MLEIDLMIPIKDKGFALLDNFERTIKTANFDYILYNVPVWKHIYHALYWVDYWFCGPENYIGADFHEEGLDSIDIQPNKQITKEQLLLYQQNVAKKSKEYLCKINDDMLNELPKGCNSNRLGLILGQFRHAYVHLGNVNCTTIIETGEWPLVAGKADDHAKGLYGDE